MLLPESSKSSFMGNVGLLKLTLQLEQLSLTLLVELNLSAGVGSRLLQPTTEVLDVPRQGGPVLLGLSPVLPLNVKLLVQFLNPGLELLHLLVVLAAESSFILNFGLHGSHLLLLSHQGGSQVSLDAVQVSHGFLSQLQVAFNFALQFLDIALGLLFPFKGIFRLIQGLLKFTLDFAQVVAPVFHCLGVFLCLLSSLASTFLLLLELGNQLLLVGDLFPQGVDLVVLGAFILFALLTVCLQSLDGVP